MFFLSGARGRAELEVDQLFAEVQVQTFVAVAVVVVGALHLEERS